MQCRSQGDPKIAEDVLEFLYTDEGQEIIAKHHYRPTNPEVLAKHKDSLQEIELFPITDNCQGLGRGGTAVLRGRRRV